MTPILELRELRVHLATLGKDIPWLERQCSYQRGSLSAIISRGVPHWPTRWRIERGLGYSVAIWTAPAVLDLRRKCSLRFALDPFTVTRIDLLAFAQRIGAEVSVRDSRDPQKLRDTVIAFLAAHPNLLNSIAHEQKQNP